MERAESLMFPFPWLGFLGPPPRPAASTPRTVQGLLPQPQPRPQTCLHRGAAACAPGSAPLAGPQGSQRHRVTAQGAPASGRGTGFQGREESGPCGGSLESGWLRAGPWLGGDEPTHLRIHPVHMHGGSTWDGKLRQARPLWPGADHAGWGGTDGGRRPQSPRACVRAWRCQDPQSRPRVDHAPFLTGPRFPARAEAPDPWPLGFCGASGAAPRRGRGGVPRGAGALGKRPVRGCSHRVPAPSRRERAQRGLPDCLAAALVAFPKGTDGGCWSHVPPLPAFQPPRHSQQRGPGTPSAPLAGAPPP